VAVCFLFEDIKNQIDIMIQ